MDFMSSNNELDVLNIIENYVAKFDENKFIEMANTSVLNYKPYTFMNWSDELLKSSIPYFEVKISGGEIFKMLEKQMDYNDNPKLYDELEFFKNLKLLIEVEFKNKKFFAKYFTRSAKDLGQPVYNDAYEMMESMLNSMRVFEDFCTTYRATENINELVIYLRPYIEFEKENEYRLFYVNGVVSYCNNYYVGYNESEKKIEKTNIIDSDVLEFLHNKIVPHFDIKDFCVDLVKIENKFIILEFNPWFLSDNIILDLDKIGKETQQANYI